MLNHARARAIYFLKRICRTNVTEFFFGLAGRFVIYLLGQLFYGRAGKFVLST
jgi:hypothetical protein